MPVSLIKKQRMDARSELPGWLPANNSVLDRRCQPIFVQSGELFTVIQER
jgi:hypothetical protein